MLQNLLPEDRAAAIAVIDDDAAFDRWMQDYQRKNAGGKKSQVSQGQYLARFARIHDENEEG